MVYKIRFYSSQLIVRLSVSHIFFHFISTHTPSKIGKKKEKIAPNKFEATLSLPNLIATIVQV